MFRNIFIMLALCLVVAGTAVAAERAGKNPVVAMETSLGTITLELFQGEAPVTVNNFMSYVKSGFYGGTTFHRVIAGFMIQGGGFTAALEQKPAGMPIGNEANNGLKNNRGTIAMARTADPDSATSQFFINVVNNSMLNRPQPDGHGYAVFGRVIAGMDVVDRIAAVRTGVRSGYRDVPVQPVSIKAMKLIK
jgi:peptidyl-prolyl cis-trans isomerase A (cyclophilin A)